MSQSDLQHLDCGSMDIFMLIGMCNFERGPKPDLVFYIRAQFVAELRCTRNVTVANVWIKCLRCGNILNQKANAVQRRHVTSAIWPLHSGVTKFNTTHLTRHIKKQKHVKLNNELTQAIQAKTWKQQTLADTFERTEKYPQDSDMAKNWYRGDN